jgi:hypothetical protein
MQRLLYLILIILNSSFLIRHLQALPAFPGAEGYGSETTHGRGGRVIIVNNNNSEGPGSLKNALGASRYPSQSIGPRIIVFRTSGVINLSPGSQWYFDSPKYSNYMVAGQTSPGGITITAGGSNTPFFQYNSSATTDFVWRFIRFRVKDNCEHSFQLQQSSKFIIDHCNFSGGKDEVHDVCHSYNFTFQYCVFGNASPGGQGYGSLVAYKPLYQISFHHNLWADVSGRNGGFFHWGDGTPINNGKIDFRNNVCYDWGSFCTAVQHMGAPAHINYVNNLLKSGPHSSSKKPLYIEAEAHLHQSGNVWVRGASDTVTGDLARRDYGMGGVIIAESFDMSPVTTVSAQEAYADVIDKAGALPRDPMAVRTINDVKNNTGRYSKVDDPLVTTGPLPPDDTDMDGMPDCWETAMGFNPNSASDNIGDHDGDGYTNIEEYINDLAFVLLGEPTHNGELQDGCPTDIESGNISMDNGFKLSVNPNPVGSRTIIQLNRGQRSEVRGQIAEINILNIAGKVVCQLTSDLCSLTSGIAWNASKYAPGVYFIRLVMQQKVLLQKKLIVTY